MGSATDGMHVPVLAKTVLLPERSKEHYCLLQLSKESSGRGEPEELITQHKASHLKVRNSRRAAETTASSPCAPRNQGRTILSSCSLELSNYSKVIRSLMRKEHKAGCLQSRSLRTVLLSS